MPNGLDLKKENKMDTKKKERDFLIVSARLERRGTATRLRDARRAHRLGGPHAAIRAYCAGNVWLTENAKSVGNL